MPFDLVDDHRAIEEHRGAGSGSISPDSADDEDAGVIRHPFGRREVASKPGESGIGALDGFDHRGRRGIGDVDEYNLARSFGHVGAADRDTEQSSAR